MENKNPVPAGTAVTGNFQLTAQLPNGKTFSVSGYLFDGESVESVNQRVDLLHDVLDRQRMRAEIPELEAKLDQRIIQLGQLHDALAALEAKKSGGGKISANERALFPNYQTSIVRLNEDILKGRAEIKANKEKVGIA